jgi:hypothetical protein
MLHAEEALHHTLGLISDALGLAGAIEPALHRLGKLLRLSIPSYPGRG